MTLFPPRSFQDGDRMPETETVDGVPRDFVRIAADGNVLITAEGLGIQAADYIAEQMPAGEMREVLLYYRRGLLAQMVADGFTPDTAAAECAVFLEAGLARLDMHGAPAESLPR